MTHVVGGERELPAAEARVQIAQVANGRLRAAFGVEPLVDPAIDAQAVGSCRLGHELPEPSRACVRGDARVHPALDEREPDQIFRKVRRAKGPLNRRREPTALLMRAETIERPLGLFLK